MTFGFVAGSEGLIQFVDGEACLTQDGSKGPRRQIA